MVARLARKSPPSPGFLHFSPFFVCRDSHRRDGLEPFTNGVECSSFGFTGFISFPVSSVPLEPLAASAVVPEFFAMKQLKTFCITGIGVVKLQYFLRRSRYGAASG